MSGSLVPFLDPGSVAVIGASRDPFKVGGSVVANLRSAGFRGRIIPVNSRASTVQGLAAVPRVQDVDGPVDLAVIAHIRHTHTNYDKLLMAGTERLDARAQVRGKIDQVLAAWRG